MKLCKDCVHYEKAEDYQEYRGFDRCNAEVKKVINPVDGKSVKVGDIHYCENQRGADYKNACGPQGKWWKPQIDIQEVEDVTELWAEIGVSEKKTLWQRVVDWFN